jgi:hypothetical protein
MDCKTAEADLPLTLFHFNAAYRCALSPCIRIIAEVGPQLGTIQSNRVLSHAQQTLWDDRVPRGFHCVCNSLEYRAAAWSHAAKKLATMIPVDGPFLLWGLSMIELEWLCSQV